MQQAVDLTDADLQSFDNGYLVIPLLSESEITDLKADIDELTDGANRAAKDLGKNLSAKAQERLSRIVRSPLIARVPGDGPRAHEMPALGRLTWHPRITSVVDQLMTSWVPRAEWTLSDGPAAALETPEIPAHEPYVFHHINAARHDVGMRGLPWHHDYDQYPQTNRSHLMIHVLVYLNGLDGSVGDLLLAPGTQNSVMSKRAFWHAGWEHLPNTVVIDDLPPGAAIVMNSAMLHARAPKPGGDTKPRYFIDAAYCQRGVTWPATYSGSHEGLRERHLAEGGDRPWMFDETAFFDAEYAHSITENARGSLFTAAAPGN